jgi:CRP-like cAMP-binding protein
MDKLVDERHYVNMGPAVWAYIWLVKKRMQSGNDFVVTFREIGDTYGVTPRGVMKWMERLERNGYIKTKNLYHFGKKYHVNGL